MRVKKGVASHVHMAHMGLTIDYNTKTMVFGIGSYYKALYRNYRELGGSPYLKTIALIILDLQSAQHHGPISQIGSIGSIAPK